MRVSVTYDIVTEASVVDGDHADNGYIDPRDESRRSFARGGKVRVGRNIRMSRTGRFDWTLREALEFLDNRSCQSYESCWQRSDDTLSIDGSGEYQGCDVERMGGSRVISVSYTLHIAEATYGTLDRIARLLQGRVYFANVPYLNRKRVA
jgi:hypothetical protein